ncbi:hypothetical protein ACTFIV_006032 [Dictyostelium citrinum]
MLSKEEVEKMNVKELQKELSTVGLDTKGKKAELQTRLLEHINKNGTSSSSPSVKSPTAQKTDSTSKVVPTEPVKSNIPTTSTTATTTTATTTSTTTTTATTTKPQINGSDNNNNNNSNNNIDVSTMTEEERRIHRLNKFTTGATSTTSAGATSTTTTTTSSSSSSPSSKNKIPTAAALEEEKRKRLLKFGTAPISITSPPPLPQPKVKVPKSKIYVNKKEEIYGSVSEIFDRKKKFGLASPTKSTTTANGSSLSVEERKKKFAK